MSLVDPDHEDADVPAQAVRALNAATQRAMSAGRDVVFLRGGKLVRLSGGKIIELRKLPPRRKVADFGQSAGHLR